MHIQSVDPDKGSYDDEALALAHQEFPDEPARPLELSDPDARERGHLAPLICGAIFGIVLLAGVMMLFGKLTMP